MCIYNWERNLPIKKLRTHLTGIWHYAMQQSKPISIFLKPHNETDFQDEDI